MQPPGLDVGEAENATAVRLELGVQPEGAHVRGGGGLDRAQSTFGRDTEEEAWRDTPGSIHGDQSGNRCNDRL